jgi:flagellar biogenesis protein FliO
MGLGVIGGLSALAWSALALVQAGPAGGDVEARGLGPARAAAVESRPITPMPGGDRESAVASGAWRTALSLGGVLTLIVAGGSLLRRWARSTGSLAASAGPGGRAPAGILEILGRYPVARGQTLLLLKIERRVLLVCQSAGWRGSTGGINVLAQIDDPEEVASILLKSRDSQSEALARRFEATLRAFEDRMDAPTGRAEGGTDRTASASVRRRLERLRSGVSA